MRATAKPLSPIGTKEAGGTTWPSSVTRSPWQEVGVPYSSTSGTPAQAPLADTVRAYVTDARGFATRLQVDRFGASTQVLDALSRTTTVTRDANSLVLRTSLPSGGVDSMVYNTSGLPTYIQRAGLSATNVQYDAVWNQPTNFSGTGQPTVQNFIGTRGRVDSTLVGGQAKTKYTYDSFGRVLTATDPQGHLLVKHTYAGINGNLSRDSLPGNRITTYLQDGLGRDTLVTRPLGPTARASNVFPVPGGPNSSTPLGIFAPIDWNFCGLSRNSLISRSSSTASSAPATSSKVTFGWSLLTIFAFALPTIGSESNKPPTTGIGS